MNYFLKISLLYILALFVNPIYSQKTDWSFLKKGEYLVGFKSFWETDYSRTVSYNGKTINRPILVNIWYPAKNDTLSGTMLYEDYFEINSSQANLDEISSKYKTYNLDILANELLGKPNTEFNSIEREQFQKFLKHKTSILKNVKPKKGRFPLIIYHQGFSASFEDNSVLIQMLASNGYIVIGSSYFEEEINYMGVEGSKNSIWDIQYLINYAVMLPNVDISNIALVGHSGGAQASLLAKSATKNLIKVVIAIETTQEAFGLSDTRWNSFTKPILENIINLDGSILAFTDHKAVFQLYDLMSYANRFYITFPETLNHNEYISQGILSNYLKLQILNKKVALQKLENANQDKENYILVNNYIVAFLQWKLKNAIQSKELFNDSKYNLLTSLQNPIVQSIAKGVVNVKSYSFNAKVPPSPRQVWKMAHSKDIHSLIFVLNYFKELKPKLPIFNEIFAFSLLSDLIENEHLIKAKSLYDFYLKEKIPITDRFISLSKFSLLMQKKEYAKKCLINLLKIDSENKRARELLVEFKTGKDVKN